MSCKTFGELSIGDKIYYCSLDSKAYGDEVVDSLQAINGERDKIRITLFSGRNIDLAKASDTYEQIGQTIKLTLDRLTWMDWICDRVKSDIDFHEKIIESEKAKISNLKQLLKEY